jgi:hypothetical protein
LVVLDNGQTVLSEVIKQKPIEIVQFFQILTDVALALHHLHNSSLCTFNVFDLNISSDNILVEFQLMKSFLYAISTTYEMICQVPFPGDRYKLIRLNTICLEGHPHSLNNAAFLAPEVLFIFYSWFIPFNM